VIFLEEVKKKGGKVLVHCLIGKSRSVSIVIAYFILNMGYSYEKAYNHVKIRRFIAEPNYGFAKQLMELGKK